ncbi:hypothetical protein [Moraxella canis]|uniref:Uncharacterized protein n=1 Tax=Moraxella canis TaxID=90239 RepID=A0A1S9ZN26_9GAMM|nr:hypothetical protein [Moraxella canis]OOR84790.1 hypothetical protein B0180_02365 [Moraxella canis]
MKKQNQIQEIDQQIDILTQAAHIMGEIDQLPKLRTSAFKNSIKTLVVQVLKQADKPLLTHEITKQALMLDSAENTSAEPDKRQNKAVYNVLRPLVQQGLVIQTGTRKGETRYQWATNTPKSS